MRLLFVYLFGSMQILPPLQSLQEVAHLQPYACPNCRNKMRFHIVEQHPVSVKLNPQTGEIMSYIDETDLMSHPYKGERLQVQCAICGQSGNESLFVKAAERM